MKCKCAFTDPIPLEGVLTLAEVNAAAHEPRVRKTEQTMAEYGNIQVSDSIADLRKRMSYKMFKVKDDTEHGAIASGYTRCPGPSTSLTEKL